MGVIKTWIVYFSFTCFVFMLAGLDEKPSYTTGCKDHEKRKGNPRGRGSRRRNNRCGTSRSGSRRNFRHRHTSDNSEAPEKRMSREKNKMQDHLINFSEESDEESISETSVATCKMGYFGSENTESDGSRTHSSKNRRVHEEGKGRGRGHGRERGRDRGRGKSIRREQGEERTVSLKGKREGEEMPREKMRGENKDQDFEESDNSLEQFPKQRGDGGENRERHKSRGRGTGNHFGRGRGRRGERGQEKDEGREKNQNTTQAKDNTSGQTDTSLTQTLRQKQGGSKIENIIKINRKDKVAEQEELPADRDAQKFKSSSKRFLRQKEGDASAIDRGPCPDRSGAKGKPIGKRQKQKRQMRRDGTEFEERSGHEIIEEGSDSPQGTPEVLPESAPIIPKNKTVIKLVSDFKDIDITVRTSDTYGRHPDIHTGKGEFSGESCDVETQEQLMGDKNEQNEPVNIKRGPTEKEVFVYLCTKFQGSALLRDIEQEKELFPEASKIEHWFRQHSGSFRFTFAENGTSILGVHVVHHRLKLCQFYLSKRGCTKEDKCMKFHLCKQFIAGRCPHGALCKYYHDFTDNPNKALLEYFNLQSLDDNDLIKIISVQQPHVCRRYNANACTERDKCSRIHICQAFVKGQCKKHGGTCNYSHEDAFGTAHTKGIFSSFQLEKIEGRNMLKHMLIIEKATREASKAEVEILNTEANIQQSGENIAQKGMAMYMF